MPSTPQVSNGRKIIFGACLALVVQGINGIFAYRATTEYIRTSQERRASVRLQQSVARFLSQLKDAETGQRGFLLTGDDEYLEPYERAASEIEPMFAALRAAGGERYATLLNQMEQPLRRKLNEMQKTIAVRRDPDGGAATALALVVGGTGRDDMVELRNLVGTLETEEQARGDELIVKMDGLAQTTLLRVLLVSTLAALLVGAAGWMVYRDLRRRIVIEDQLREQRSILQSILDSMADGVVVADADGKLILFNDAAERIYGRGPTEAGHDQWTSVYGLYLPDTVTPYPAEQLPLVRALRGEIVDHAELYLRDNDAREGRFQGISGRPIYDEGGAFRGGVIVSRDMTKQKLAELQILRYNEELEARVQLRTAELAEINAELLQKNQENEMFVYSVSHDLRSPLVNLQGFSRELSLTCDELRGLLADEAVPESIRTRGLTLLNDDAEQAVQFIQSAVLRLAGIINAMLRLSRAGRIEYQRQPIHLQQVVERVVTAQQSVLTEHDVTVEVRPLPDVWGDPTSIEQVFANLLENAVKYREPSRPCRITIGASDDDEVQTLDVPARSQTIFIRDNGLGIPESGVEKVFKAFERCHPGTSSGEGMGLAIVERVVHRHGGRIQVRSQLGVGSTFFVSLPLAPEVKSKPPA